MIFFRKLKNSISQNTPITLYDIRETKDTDFNKAIKYALDNSKDKDDYIWLSNVELKGGRQKKSCLSYLGDVIYISLLRSLSNDK